jgi:hypothetical protein
MIRLLKWLGLPLILALLVAALLFSSWLYTYQRLTDETLVAELSFEPVGDGRYRASVSTGDLCDVGRYDLYGDQWRIDAQFVKWKYWAALFGLDPLYRLDRLEGRYADVAEQNGRPHVAYPLGRDSPLDVTRLAASLGRLNFLLDASYGSSTFERIEPGRVYRVYRTQTGLMTRSEPRVVGEDRGGRLTIRIDRACGAGDGPWRRLSRWFSSAAG